MYERILLAYDGTLEGRVALREGALLAKRCGAHVFLLSVLPAPSVLPDGGGMGIADQAYAGAVAQQVDDYKLILAGGVEKLKQLGFDPVAKLVVGDPAPRIGAFAKEINADLVVLGHHKRSFLERWWSSGSGAFVVDHVGCSVLIGRNTVSDEAFAAALGAGG